MEIIFSANFITLRSQGWKQLSHVPQVVCSGENRVIFVNAAPRPRHPLNEMIRGMVTFWF